MYNLCAVISDQNPKINTAGQKTLINAHHVHEPVLPLLSRAIVCLSLPAGYSQRDVNQTVHKFNHSNAPFIHWFMETKRADSFEPLIQFTLVAPTVYLAQEQNAHFNSIRLLKRFKAVYKLFVWSHLIRRCTVLKMSPDWHLKQQKAFAGWLTGLWVTAERQCLSHKDDQTNYNTLQTSLK